MVVLFNTIVYKWYYTVYTVECSSRLTGSSSAVTWPHVSLSLFFFLSLSILYIYNYYTMQPWFLLDITCCTNSQLKGLIAVFENYFATRWISLALIIFWGYFVKGNILNWTRFVDMKPSRLFSTFFQCVCAWGK